MHGHRGALTLFPTLEADLACPNRYVRTHVFREEVPGPFASAALGKEVHARIARSLRRGAPVDLSPFRLPRRLVLSQGESLEGLLERARASLERFEAHHRPLLDGQKLWVEERLTARFTLDGRPVELKGRLDVLTEGGKVLDWKTSSPRDPSQLRFYLFLFHQATGKEPCEARAVGLVGGEELREAWSGEIIPWGYRRLQVLKGILEAALANPRVNPGPACRYCPYAHACPASVAPPRRLVDTLTGEARPLILGEEGLK